MCDCPTLQILTDSNTDKGLEIRMLDNDFKKC